MDINHDFGKLTLREVSAIAREHARKIAEGAIKCPKILTSRTAKMDKSAGYGVLSLVLHLQPAGNFEGVNTCRWRTPGCTEVCLQGSGRMRFGGALFARLWRTWLFVDSREFFLSKISREIEAGKNRAQKRGLGFTVRLNGTSDLCWEEILLDGANLFDRFPDVQYYDYTKSADRALSIKLPNYKLVYSHNERSIPLKEYQILSSGGSIAMVFDMKKGDNLPRTLWITGIPFPVIDGDLSDLRHLDPKGVIVGLRYKKAFSRKTGKAIAPPAGFVLSIGRVN